MIKHRKFGSISQFRYVIENVKHQTWFTGLDENEQPVYDKTIPLPTIEFNGTVKSHGSNGSIVIDNAGNYWCQSREQILDITNGLSGFYAYAENNKEYFRKALQGVLGRFLNKLSENELDMVEDNCLQLGIYGEWCGGGIQKGVAITGLPKMFIVYELYVFISQEVKISLPVELLQFHNPDINLYHINTFGNYKVDIDFNDLEKAQKELTDLTLAVEAECPIGKHFGNIGVGEGIVWKGEIKSNYSSNIQPLIFKVKGEKHSVVKHKEKVIVPIDVEKVNSVNQFVEYAATENRFEQGFGILKEQGVALDQKSIGQFIKWVMQDIIKEESDTLVKNGLTIKDVNSKVSFEAKEFWLKRIKL